MWILYVSNNGASVLKTSQGLWYEVKSPRPCREAAWWKGIRTDLGFKKPRFRGQLSHFLVSTLGIPVSPPYSAPFCVPGNGSRYRTSFPTQPRMWGCCVLFIYDNSRHRPSKFPFSASLQNAGGYRSLLHDPNWDHGLGSLKTCFLISQEPCAPRKQW